KKQNRLPAYYSASDALIVPSLYESFGLVVLEALACGTPVLLSRIGQMSRIIEEGKNGFSFQAGDPQSIADTIERFFELKEQFWTNEMIREGIIRRFSWDRAASEIFAAFVSLQVESRGATNIFRCGESPQPN
ncbi:MAG TPA: glycosyltransferase, partial [bacterium]|nr:glycosyltransferase [bacterium]